MPTLADSKVTVTISNSYTYIANLTGLTPGTTYYLRAYASNQFGTSYGAVVKFVTSATLSSVTGIVATFAGSGNPGFADGIGAGAQFNNPGGMAIDAHGNIYISDTFNNRIRKMTPDGTVTTIAGTGVAGYTPDGPAASAQFYAPAGLAVDAQGNIYVADYGNNMIRKISADGTTVSTVAGNGFSGFVDGEALKVAAFNGPSGVAVDTKGNVFVADQNNNQIRKIYNGKVSLVAGLNPGYTNATVDSTNVIWGAFNHPSAIAVGNDGNIYVADRGNSAIRKITFPGRVITTIAGGPSQTALIGLPSGLAIDLNNNIFITDENGKVIELTSAHTLYDLAGTSGVYGFADGTGSDAQFNQPQGIVVDGSGDIFVADYNNNRIRKVTISTVNN
jgi:streptogramin lyase